MELPVDSQTDTSRRSIEQLRGSAGRRKRGTLPGRPTRPSSAGRADRARPTRGAVVAHSANVPPPRGAGGCGPRPGRCGAHGGCVRRRIFAAAREKPPRKPISEVLAAGGVNNPPQNRISIVAAVGDRRGAHTAMPPATAKPSHRPPRVHVDRIVTEPMTSQQRKLAVTALAALIAAWRQDQDAKAKQADLNLVTPLPLPGPASDTDHAA